MQLKSTHPLSIRPLAITWKFILAFMATLYLVNALTPLHLHVDSIRYYNLRTCLEVGCDPNSFAAKDFLPYGYTFLLIALSKIGLLKAFAIVLMNCFFLFAGLHFLTRILREYISSGIVVLLTIFNWTIIKFAIHPLSEMQYIFFTCSSLYCFYLYLKKNNYGFLGLSFLLCFLAILTRTIGIALLPALILGVVWQYRIGLKEIILKNKMIVIAAILAGGILLFFAKQLRIVDYTSALKGQYESGMLHFFLQNFQFHFKELAEIFFNIPASRFLDKFAQKPGNVFFLISGMLLFLWLLYLLFIKKTRLPFFIKAYLLFYLFIIMNWPYYDPRFWVPVIPIVAAIFMSTDFNTNRLIKVFSKIYLTYYLVAGAAAATYTLYIGLDKKTFAKEHAKGIYRNEYEQHFFGKPLSDTALHIDANVVEILKEAD